MAIPAIDLLHGKAVRLVRGDREQATVYAENPTELVARFAAAGARRLHLVDLDGAFGEPRQQQLVRAMVTAAHGEGLEVEVGGGLRSRAAVAATLTETGADYAVVGTLAVRQPEAAEELCTALVRAGGVQTQAAEVRGAPSDAATLLEEATPPDTPVAPKPLRNAILAFLAALVVGSAAAYARSALTDRYASAEEAAHDLGLPVLASVSRSSPDTAEAVEAFRVLRTSVSYALREHVGPVLMVTSATPGSGKTHISINMAQSFAAEGRRVILVDCDFRRPAVNKRLGIPIKPGMTDLVGGTGAQSPELAGGRLPLWSLPVPGATEYLDVVPAGSSILDPAAALTTDRAAQVFDNISAQYDLSVIDSPPTLPVVDPLVLAHYADGVLFVVDGRKDRRSDVRRALETLRAVDAPVIGFVFNSASAPERRYSYSDQRGLHEAEVVRASA